MGTATTSRVVLLDGSQELSRDVVGGKAASIQRMRRLGIPVPPAFVVTTAVCREYHATGRRLPDEVLAQVRGAMAALEDETGRTFGSGRHPLLVSVRSGASTSMPGMMDTVLNLGLTDAVADALVEESGRASYVADTARRFAEQFHKVVGTPAPTSPWDQLDQAVRAVLDSWNSRRAVAYREARGISHDGGTAVTVQAMVFGNLDERSGTGVLFSRDPLTGEAQVYGEWLPEGQGEDVVSGRSDARPLADLAADMPAVHAELMAATTALERAGRDVQDIEFTVEGGRLWLLQSRSAKRSPEAALRCAVRFEAEGLIDSSEALDRITPAQVRALLHPRLAAADVAGSPPVASGKPAAPGVATGLVVTDADDAEDLAAEGTAVVLARPTTDPDDVAGMSASVAVLTELGGSTSHAAVVCREMAVPCVVGCGVGSVTALAGQVVTVDATSGTVHLGELSVEPPVAHDDADLVTIAGWLAAELDEREPHTGPHTGPAVITLLERRHARRARS